MKRILIGIAGLLLILIGYVWLSADRLPPDLLEAVNGYDVEILRDEWGVPHIFGTTDADVAFGLAYAHAEDDFETMQGVLLAARGRLASVYGRDAAPNDYMVHLLRIRDVVEAGYDTLPDDVRALCEGYAAGMNYYAARYPDQARAGLYPVQGEDLVAGFIHKIPLFFGIDRTLQDLFADQRKQEVSVRGDIPGSNVFAVAPSRSTDGSTMLAINSHQPWMGPVAWYEVHLKSEQGWDMVGSLFPGSPVVLHGHNRHLGWAYTVNKPDLVDVYVLDINPENPNQYRLDGQWLDLEVRQAPIEVKLWGPVRWTFKREVLWSKHGPVVRQDHGTYAIRFAGYGEVRQIEQWYRMNKATTFEQWEQAQKMLAIPMFNVGYADRDGTIYYLYNGLLPVRTEGYDWSKYLPGDTSETIWTEYLPFEALPKVKNPASGFIQNANSTPFMTTTGTDNPTPADFSPTLGIETHLTNRALRAFETFGIDSSITEAEFYRYKFDLAYSDRSRMARFIRQVQSVEEQVDAPTWEAIEVLKDWNRETDPENTETALAVLAFHPFLDQYDQMIPTDTLLVHLKQAAQILQTHHGLLTPAWATVNRLRRGTVDLGVGGGPDIAHAVYGRLTDDGRLAGWAGDSYVLMVRWDSTGQVSSRSIHQFGSAVLDSTSVHYADQAELFVEKQLKPVWMDEDEIRTHLEKAYRLKGK